MLAENHAQVQSDKIEGIRQLMDEIDDKFEQSYHYNERMQKQVGYKSFMEQHRELNPNQTLHRVDCTRSRDEWEDIVSTRM